MSDKKGKKSHLPVRLNILFFLVFLLFSALILRLGVVQIVQGEEFQEQVEKTINVSVPVDAPRGLIYDRYGNLLVDNELLFTVTYTNRNTSQEEMLETARKLSKFITVELPRINDRDLREYWGVLNPEEFEAKLTEEEAEEEGIDEKDIHSERIKRITEEELDSISEEDMRVFPIWREFNAGYNNLPHKVKRGITYEEAALIMENLEELPGVDIIRDAERTYVYDDYLKSILGKVGPIHREDIDYFLANGYERNEEVGTEYLEAQYETVLRGRKGRLENFIDSDGNFLKNPEEQLGSRGNDLVLSIDLELHQHIKAIIDDVVNSSKSSFVGEPDAYVVMMEPHTGEVLSLAGYRSDVGTFTSAFVVGSSMKGATVLAGLDTGVVAPETQILDRTLNLPGSPSISSWRTLGYVNAERALELSSNIYMSEVAMRLIGYIPGVSGTNWGDFYKGYDILRSYYAQLGLGVPTGIDLPNEFPGIVGEKSSYPGQLLYLTFGQYDTYTPLQLAQYVSTIANDGYRIAPRVVKEIREPGKNKDELGPISQKMEPKVLNKLDTDPRYFQTVQNGFYRVIHGSGGTARNYFNGVDYEPAGKTGTAQVKVNGRDANNQTFVAYAPFDEPEVAISVVVPGVQRNAGGIANTIARKSLDAYFKLKEERNGPFSTTVDYDDIESMYRNDDEEE